MEVIEPQPKACTCPSGDGSLHWPCPVHPPEAQPVSWRPMDTAPRDGTMVRLLVDFEDHATEDVEGPSSTIGANYFDHSGEDRWQFAGWCWCHDCFAEGKGTPVGWLPMLTEGVQQPVVVDEAMVDRAWRAYYADDGTAREGIRAALIAALSVRQGE